MAEVFFDIDRCNGSEYVLFPACAYDGNRFKALKKSYPPVFLPGECSVDMETIITDVPRLNQDGSGKIEITTGDLSVPCVGVYTPGNGTCHFIFTVQAINGKNLGMAYEKGKVSISYPAKREFVYRWPQMIRNEEEFIDLHSNIPSVKLTFPCASLREFYEIFFTNRKIMRMDDSKPVNLPGKEQITIQLKKFNQLNWHEKKGFYGDVCSSDLTDKSWGTGWCGGGISSYAMMKLGGDLEYKRAVKTLKFLFSIQGESGFFYDSARGNGEAVHGLHAQNESEHPTLIRRSADALYFLYKHFEQMENVPHQMIRGAKKCADAFVTLWHTYGQLGYAVDADTGNIIAGGSACASLAPAALVSSYEYFNNMEYLKTAEAIGQHFYDKYLSKGYTNGGPGDILLGPDSESAFALLESYVELYGVTQKEKWLEYALFAAHLCSSWVVPYNYRFPKESEFHKQKMKTVGTVFANVQNKHSAPGICTLSGNSLMKLYKITQNPLYLELYEEISSAISQYMSTDKRPIYSWDVPKDAAARGLLDVKVEPEILPSGYICERVNMSDWESYRCIGGVFNGSCWCEVSNLLTLAESYV